MPREIFHTGRKNVRHLLLVESKIFDHPILIYKTFINLINCTYLNLREVKNKICNLGWSSNKKI